MQYSLYKMAGLLAKRVLQDGTTIYGYIRDGEFAYEKGGEEYIITLPDDGDMRGFSLLSND